MLDISVYISDLLFEHECVIVPGFGGFVSNYKPAEIVAVQHLILPPSKSLSFNRHLKNNDGLLVNIISTRLQITFDEAQEIIANWVKVSGSLLKRQETLTLKRVGVLQNDMEGNLQFAPDTSVNYLKSSFGLPVIENAVPVMRGKEVFSFDHATNSSKLNTPRIFNWRSFKIAAIVLMLLGIAGLTQLMWRGFEIKALNLDEASVMNFIPFFNTAEPVLEPLPVEYTPSAVIAAVDSSNQQAVDTAADVSGIKQVINAAAAITESKVITPNTIAKGNKGYFVIIGAFREQKNVENAMYYVAGTFPGKDVFVQSSSTLTQIGYYAGSDYETAKKELDSAQTISRDYWLLKK